MRDYNIAPCWNQFDENPTWQDNPVYRRTIMSIQSKYWITIAVYLINLWCMSFVIIMVLTKLL